MQFVTNLFAHAFNEVTIAQSMRSTYSERGFRTMLTRTLDITGEILDEGVSAITTRINAIETYYPGLLTSAALYDDDGNLTAHLLTDDADCFGGIRVMQISYPNGDGAEYVNGRKFSISLEADFIDRSGGELVEWQQTIRRVGTGGPRFAMQEVLEGPPVRQITNKRTIQTVSQSGSAKGLTGYPLAFVPKPVLPNAEYPDRRELTEGPYEWKGTRKFNFQYNWSYYMEF